MLSLRESTSPELTRRRYRPPRPRAPFVNGNARIADHLDVIVASGEQEPADQNRACQERRCSYSNSSAFHHNVLQTGHISLLRWNTEWQEELRWKETSERSTLSQRNAIPAGASDSLRIRRAEPSSPRVEKRPAKTWGSGRQIRTPRKNTPMPCRPREQPGTFAPHGSLGLPEAWAGRVARPSSSSAGRRAH